MKTSITSRICYSPARSSGSSINTIRCSLHTPQFVNNLKALRESEINRLQAKLLSGASALSIAPEVAHLFQSALAATLEHVAFPPEACVAIYGSLSRGTPTITSDIEFAVLSPSRSLVSSTLESAQNRVKELLSEAGFQVDRKLEEDIGIRYLEIEVFGGQEDFSLLLSRDLAWDPIQMCIAGINTLITRTIILDYQYFFGNKPLFEAAMAKARVSIYGDDKFIAYLLDRGKQLAAPSLIAVKESMIKRIYFLLQTLRVKHGIIDVNTFATIAKLVDRTVLASEEGSALIAAMEFSFKVRTLWDLIWSSADRCMVPEDHRKFSTFPDEARTLFQQLGLADQAAAEAVLQGHFSNVVKIYQWLFPE
jgi:predicted nucleotidyltransferase